MRCFIAIAAALALGGCTSAIFEAPSHEPSSYETVQLFYRPLAASAVRPMVGTAAIEIAELRPSVAPQPGDWATCARAWKDGKPLYFAVFIRSRAVIDTRGATMIDRCESDRFSAFETAVYRR